MAYSKVRPRTNEFAFHPLSLAEIYFDFTAKLIQSLPPMMRRIGHRHMFFLWRIIILFMLIITTYNGQW